MPFMEPVGSLPCSQEPTTGPCLEDRLISPLPPFSPKAHFDISSHLCLGLPSGFLPTGFPPKILYAFLISIVCYMPHPSHPPWFDHPNNIWWSVQVMKLLIIQSSPASCHFFPPRFKYSPQLPIPKHLQYVCSSWIKWIISNFPILRKQLKTLLLCFCFVISMQN